jgi:hypothetical protein
MNMEHLRRLAGFFFFVALLPRALAEDLQTKNDVHWCSTIPTLPVLQEAQFTAVYVFELDGHGKPFNIRQAHVPFISRKDSALISCIADWRLPKSNMKGTATFSFKWEWTGLEVIAGDFTVAVPAKPRSARAN